jgi:hypothetical protein
LPSRFTKRWHEVRGQQPLNERRVAAYERLMQAEEQITQERLRNGASEAEIARALEISEAGLSEIEDDDLYVTVLSRYVSALGGRLEGVAAVFHEGTVRLQDPGSARPS